MNILNYDKYNNNIIAKHFELYSKIELDIEHWCILPTIDPGNPGPDLQAFQLESFDSFCTSQLTQ